MHKKCNLADKNNRDAVFGCIHRIQFSREETLTKSGTMTQVLDAKSHGQSDAWTAEGSWEGCE